MSDERPTPLDFLQAVYCNEGLPLSTRMKAAIEAAPYVHPKLSATAVMSSEDFGCDFEKPWREAAVGRAGISFVQVVGFAQVADAGSGRRWRSLP
jgi:hypothetical protein